MIENIYCAVCEGKRTVNLVSKAANEAGRFQVQCTACGWTFWASTISTSAKGPISGQTNF